MNKAFTKESDESFDDPIPEPKDLLPPGARNYVTPQGAELLRLELKNLVEIERPRVAEGESREAGPEGDASMTKRKRLQAIDRRIIFLRDRVASMEVVDPRKGSSDRVRFGVTVTVLDDDEKEKTYKIVGVDEADPSAEKVSWLSPIAKALMGKQVGDVVSLILPKGDVELEVLEIENS
jgi:transcription elongation factor GreB